MLIIRHNFKKGLVLMRNNEELSHNFNLMQLWDNVLAAKGHQQPTILVIVNNTRLQHYIQDIIQENWPSNPKFVIKNELSIGMMSPLLNVNYCSGETFRKSKGVKCWRDYDYLLTGEPYSDLALEAMASGVTVLHNANDLEKILSQPWEQNLGERVDNFETIKAFLTKHNH